LLNRHIFLIVDAGLGEGELVGVLSTLLTKENNLSAYYFRAILGMASTPTPTIATFQAQKTPAYRA
jgi:hypothetical protein